MIREDYVSFETAKLLKEKGFDELTYACFTFDGDDLYGYRAVGDDIMRPTLQTAMKWMREKHNIHIMIDCIGSKNYLPTAQYTNNSEDVIIEGNESKIGGRGMDSYEEACEAAIKYCLENLI